MSDGYAGGFLLSLLQIFNTCRIFSARCVAQFRNSQCKQLHSCEYNRIPVLINKSFSTKKIKMLVSIFERGLINFAG